MNSVPRWRRPYGLSPLAERVVQTATPEGGRCYCDLSPMARSVCMGDIDPPHHDHQQTPERGTCGYQGWRHHVATLDARDASRASRVGLHADSAGGTEKAHDNPPCPFYTPLEILPRLSNGSQPCWPPCDHTWGMLWHTRRGRARSTGGPPSGSCSGASPSR